jgi:hypothetical protein
VWALSCSQSQPLSFDRARSPDIAHKLKEGEVVAVANPQLDVSRTAMLNMDLQAGIVPIYTRDQPDFGAN